MMSRFFTTRKATAGLACAALAAGLVVAQEQPLKIPSESPATHEFVLPPGLPEITHPEDNPADPTKIELGKMLFFDKRLSEDKTVSCATCHDPEKGWSNNEAVATGVGGKKGGRNSPTIINSVYNKFHFWDGRASSLEDQALGPIQNPIEMNMSMDLAIERLDGIAGYRERFKEVFGDPTITDQRIARAIGAYERTVVSGDAPYDRFKAGDKDALSEAAQRGMKLFFGKAACSGCHIGPNFTDHGFHNIGIGMDKPEPDPGRAAISKLQGDTGAFKTPTLREIDRTAPYMHDGSLKTLEEVVDHYDKGGIQNPYLDEQIFPLELTAEEKKDLVQFLKEGLASENYPLHKAPKLPE